MRFFIFVCLLTFSMLAMGQKKVVPASNSLISGMFLPSGSMQDKRFLSISAARTLMEMEVNEVGFSIGDLEVYYLPPVSKFGFNLDSFNKAILSAGWMIEVFERNNKFKWLHKNDQRLLVYLDIQEKETQLYFGKTSPKNGFVDVKKEGASATSNNQPNVNVKNNVPAPASSTQPTSNNSTAKNNSGIVFSTINFDDGWIAVPQEDWVLVTKGANKTYLHFAIPLPEELRSGSGEPILDYFWNRLIVNRYRAGQIERRPFDPYDYKRLYFQEADATDPITKQMVHVALRIVINSGIASCIEIVTPSRRELYSLFPDIAKTDQMLFYNRFAIHPSDIVGEWDESSGSFVQYYNAYTGANMGMNAVSVNSHMSFGADNRYVLEHKGASGMVGSQQFFQEKYTGFFQLTNWSITVKDQNGKETTYHAYYQAVKGGRILQLQNKQYAGSTMALIKVR